MRGGKEIKYGGKRVEGRREGKERMEEIKKREIWREEEEGEEEGRKGMEITKPRGGGKGRWGDVRVFMW